MDQVNNVLENIDLNTLNIKDLALLLKIIDSFNSKDDVEVI